MLENKREVIAFLQRCPNSEEKGSMTEKGIDGRHGAFFQSVGAPNSFAEGFERVDKLWIIS